MCFPFLSFGIRLFNMASALGILAAQTQAAGLAANPLPREVNPEVQVIPGSTYQPSIPRPESILGFPVGQRAATPAQVTKCLQVWTTAATNTTRLVEYARSHEGHPLHYVIVTAPQNLQKLDEIRSGIARLADPRLVNEAEAQRLIQSLPAVAWLAYTIHGDETEGSDASLAVLYHLIAGDDADVRQLRERLIIIIDPLMNPDGRERFLKMVAEHRGASPNLDDHSLLHTGYWPRGRGNHYLFDLNRDWLVAVHPETRGRIREISRWNPQLMVDAHGMGPQDTHLFSPPREPINPHIPQGRSTLSGVFARDQAAAFDLHKLVYYTGEWHEEWFPGYSDAWASYRGAIGILYEQARIAEDGVRRPGGRVLTYPESVLHHVVGSLANLNTAQRDRERLLAHLYTTRKTALDPSGPYASQTFAILPTQNRSRLTDFVDLMHLQGIETFQVTNEVTLTNARSQMGSVITSFTLPSGSILIPNRQPLGHLIAAFLEFDPHMSPAALDDERKDLLAKGESRIYDTTAWNLTMLYGLEAYTLRIDLPPSAMPLPPGPLPPSAQNLATPSTPPAAWIVDGADDAAISFAAKLLEQGVEIRASEKAFTLDTSAFSRGSVVVLPLDNRHRESDLASLAKILEQTARLCGVPLHTVSTGLGEGDLPDLGGRHFRRLEAPRIAIAGRDGFDPSDYGSIWFAVDRHLGIRHSHITDAPQTDLSRYNVIILPSGRGADTGMIGRLRDWVRDGGTLIAVGSSIAPLTAEKAEFCATRLLPDVFPKIVDYELAIHREWLADQKRPLADTNLWSYFAPSSIRYPWQPSIPPPAAPDEKEWKRRDAWQALFMPQGAIVAARVNTNHWLTAGCDSTMPVLVGPHPLLMSDQPDAAPIRYGVFTASASGANTNAPADTSSKEGKKDVPRIGWYTLPEGVTMQLRMSGLLWPEAAHRIANAAWVVREPQARGQVILFATPPTFRGSTRSTTRVFLNAVVCGPGMGSRAVIRP